MTRISKLSIALFIFLSMNREFSFFGFDLRFMLAFLFMVSIIIDIKSFVNTRLGWNPFYTPLFLYYAAISVSCFGWIRNGLPIDSTAFFNLLVVHGLNLLFLVVIMLYSQIVTKRFVGMAILFSGLVLALSEVLVYLGFDISVFLSSPEVRVIQEGGEHFNAFGEHFRVSGFAEDPNYACFFNLLTILFAGIMYKERKILCVAAGIMNAIAVLLSFSRTIILASVFACIILLIIKLLPKYRFILLQFIPLVILTGVVLLPYLSRYLHIDILQTVLTRFELWENARDLFARSPIVGNGLTAFRSYNAVVNYGWYVHCHNTFWSALSESGVLAFLPLCAAYLVAIKKSANHFKLLILEFAFLLFSINFDATYLQVLPIVLVLIPVTYISSKSNAVL